MLSDTASRCHRQVSWCGKCGDFAETAAGDPILTRHFGYDIQIRRAYDFFEATEAGDGASQA
jgi:hypothetical protein